MPGPLRRLCSQPSVETLDDSRCISKLKRRDSSESEGTKSPCKRRRLLIKGSSCAAASTPSTLCNSSSPQQVSTEPGIVEKLPVFPDTPAARAEYIERMLVCVAAREAICAFLKSDGDATAVQSSNELRMRAQVFACYLVQVFFTSSSLKTEDHGATAIAAASAAIKTFGMQCNSKDVMQLWNSRHPAVQETKLAAESEAEITTQISLLEERLLLESRLLQLSHLDEPLEHLAGHLLTSLSDRKAHLDKPLEYLAADISGTELKQTVQRLIVDGFLGSGSLRLSPPAMVSGALVMASKLICSRSSLAASTCEEEVIRLLCSNCKYALTHVEIKSAVGEIARVYRAWVVQAEQTAFLLKCEV